jgi:antagonist of KipI
MTLRVLRPGALATVQDLGRVGLQHLAIVPGGAMDPASHRVSNALVGNRDDAATLEIALSGPELLFGGAGLVALHGARFEAALDGAPFPLSRPVLVQTGARLRIGRALAGCFAYLAVAGGIDVPRVLGSRGTYLPGAFGGLRGASVTTGAILPSVRAADALAASRFACLEARHGTVPVGRAGRSVRWLAPASTLPATDPAVVRAVDGVHATLFPDATRAAFFGERWRVAPDSNRMGYRLLGLRLELLRPTEIVSQATCLGTVQVPSSGQPIVLMADHQTTGGYPKIAEVIAADVPLVAQAPPGATVRFVRVTLEEADAAREAAGRDVDRLVDRILWEFGDEDG